MTTRMTTVGTSKQGRRGVLAMMAVTLTVLGGALLWQLRPADEPAAPAATVTVSTVQDGVPSLGGMAELLLERQRETATRPTPVTPIGGMAELYAEQQAAARMTANGSRCGLVTEQRDC